MKKIILFLAFASSLAGYSQAITVSTNAYSVPQLVNTVLINSPCVSAQNITSITGTNYGSSNGIGFFQNTNPNFPMQSGVIMSTGNVVNAAGPNTTVLNDGNANWPGDSSLENTLLQAGIPMHSVNATILEFDFTPISPTFSFDFLFASEEYGNFQCQFSDAFAFLLTNTVTGVTTNLAVVPNTNVPISVVTIRDFLYNSSCPSANPQYFGSYNGGSAAATSAINFNGQTKMMNASAVLTPNTPYHIKLVIADRSDESSDSAIFISSDTFNIGQDVLGQDVTLSSPNAPCFGDNYVVNSNLNPANYTFSWTKDGQPISGADGPSITITQPGSYGITYQNTINSCVPVTDFVNIAYQPQIQAGTPNNLYKCDISAATYTYDLSLNTPVVKAGMDPLTQVSYYATAADANAGNSNTLPLNFTTAPGRTIYVRIKNANNNCYIVKSFDLMTSPSPVANVAPNLTKCSTSEFNNTAFYLPAQDAAILNGQSPTAYNVTYYTTLANAQSGTNAVVTHYATNNTTVYARVQSAYDSTCYSITSFILYISPLPLVDTKDPVVVCEPYPLPPLTNGHYFSGPNGTGTALFPGDLISTTQMIYIYNTNAEGCSAGNSFLVTIIDPTIFGPSSGTHCGSFTLPTLAFGKYFTGPNGTGTEIPSGTVITTSQTVYIYFVNTVAPFCVIATGFDVTIVPGVTVGTFPDVFECTSYTLPPLTVGKYYTEANAGGTEMPAGTQITTSMPVYVHAVTQNDCVSESQFSVYIGIVTPPNVEQCDPYVLPALPIGHYYTGPQGTGQQIASGTAINTSQTVYIYVPGADCTNDIHFTLSIAQPLVDILPNVSACESYTLPPLTNGEYFSDGNGTGTHFYPGDIITSTRAIFIYKRASPTCSNQSAFTITINPKPAIDSRSDIDVCNSYTLTQLALGNYYTGPGGSGTMLPAGTVLTSSQTIYIYAVSAEPPFCTAENSFNITIFLIEADQPANVIACDSYTLPPVTIGNYYAAPNGPHAGEGNLMHAGDVITTSKTIYVYTESGERINCTDENAFTVTINKSPIVAPVADVHICNSYTLPALRVGNYFTASGGTGTMLHEGDILTTNQTVYVYAETATTPNCTDEKSFNVNLFQVDKLQDVTTCSSYTLPVLTVGKYYTASNGTGSLLSAGQTVYSSQIIYIYAVSPFTPTCSDESDFTVTIVPAPVANPVGSALTTVCDEDGTNDGITSLDLTTLSTSVLGSQTGPEFSVAYYESMADAENNVNPVVSTTSAAIFVKVSNALTAQLL